MHIRNNINDKVMKSSLKLRLRLEVEICNDLRVYYA